jgi:hypothetical protein
LSEFTFAILVKEVNKRKINSAVRKWKAPSCLFPANETWFAVVTEDGAENGSEQARQLSAELNTHSFSFVHAEDHGWHYELYENGERKGTLEFNYETCDHSSIDDANVPLLKKLAIDEVALGRLERVLGARTPQAEDLLHSVEHFKQALGFEKISWISYEYVSTMSKRQLDEIGATFIKLVTKRFLADKIIVEVLDEPLRHMGYVYEERPEMGDRLYFVKRENGFDYGLMIDMTQKNTIEPRLFTPRNTGANMFYIAMRGLKSFEYANEHELRQHLEEIVRVFQQTGDSWLKKNRIEIFDANPLYVEMADPFMAEYAFQRIHMDDRILFGGKVIYQGNRMQIEFTHIPKKASIVTYLVEETGKKSLQDFLVEHRDILPVDIRTIHFLFQNRDEFVQALERTFDLLRFYFKQKQED